MGEYIRGGGGDNSKRLLGSQAQVAVYTATDVRVFQVGKLGSGFVKVRTHFSLVSSSLVVSIFTKVSAERTGGQLFEHCLTKLVHEFIFAGKQLVRLYYRRFDRQDLRVH